MNHDPRLPVQVLDPVPCRAQAPSQALTCSRGCVPYHEPDLTQILVGLEQHGGLCCVQCSRSAPSEAASAEYCLAGPCLTNQSAPGTQWIHTHTKRYLGKERLQNQVYQPGITRIRQEKLLKNKEFVHLQETCTLLLAQDEQQCSLYWFGARKQSFTSEFIRGDGWRGWRLGCIKKGWSVDRKTKTKNKTKNKWNSCDLLCEVTPNL